MINPVTLRSWVRNVSPLLESTEAIAIAEFAVSLPLLIVLVVGVFDFGGAFNTKQELNNAMREAAQFGSIQPTNDLIPVPATAPPSVDAIRFVVDSYLKAAKINDCRLDSAPIPGTVGGLTWTYQANTGCGGQTLLLTINRGVTVPEVLKNGPTINVVCTQVQIAYPYRWHFNSVIQLLIPGASFGLTNISTDATAVNLD